MNRFCGESKGWFNDLKLIFIVEFEIKFNCYLLVLEMCKVYESLIKYNYKKWI